MGLAKYLFLGLMNGVAFAIRMMIIFLGCFFITQIITGWFETNWRYAVIYCLVLLVYMNAAMVQWTTDYLIKQDKKP